MGNKEAKNFILQQIKLPLAPGQEKANLSSEILLSNRSNPTEHHDEKDRNFPQQKPFISHSTKTHNVRSMHPIETLHLKANAILKALPSKGTAPRAAPEINKKKASKSGLALATAILNPKEDDPRESFKMGKLASYREFEKQGLEIVWFYRESMKRKWRKNWMDRTGKSGWGRDNLESN